jgi:hypothetical protein
MNPMAPARLPFNEGGVMHEKLMLAYHGHSVHIQQSVVPGIEPVSTNYTNAGARPNRTGNEWKLTKEGQLDGEAPSNCIQRFMEGHQKGISFC